PNQTSHAGPAPGLDAGAGIFQQGSLSHRHLKPPGGLEDLPGYVGQPLSLQVGAIDDGVEVFFDPGLAQDRTAIAAGGNDRDLEPLTPPTGKCLEAVIKHPDT